MEIQKLNQNKWGVWGFVAAIQAAYVNKTCPISLEGTMHDILFPVIKDFCEKNPDLERELLDFSATFPSMPKYNSFNEVLPVMTNDTEMNKPVGLAMTGKAMSRLCRQLGLKNGDFHGTTASTNKMNFFKNSIYGLGSSREKSNFRYGLQHWIYVDNDNRIMTWGNYSSKDFLMTYFDKVTHYITGLQ